MLSFKEYRLLKEAVYPGNIGIMELVKFYNNAPPEKIKQVKTLIATQQHSKAWDIVQDHLGIKLDKSGISEEL